MDSRLTGNLSSISKAILVLSTVITAGNNASAYAADSTTATGRDNARDMNLFQIEPTVIDERYYTSGRAERHQKTSPTLPYGAPIPDNDAAPPIEVKPVVQTESKPKAETGATSTSTSTSNAAASNSSAHTTEATSKLDAAIQLQINQLKPGEDKAFKLLLKCSTADSLLLKSLKEVKNLRVISVDKTKNEVTVEAQSSSISALSGLREVQQITPFQTDK
jgi:hypothetical protein